MASWDSFMPFGTLLCPLGLRSAHPSLCVSAPSYVCALHPMCALSVLCVRTPLRCARPGAILSPLGLIYVHWGLIYAPWDSIMPIGSSFMPLGAQLCPLGLFYAPPGAQVRAPFRSACPPDACTSHPQAAV
jgi:hypothetical protein